MPLPIGDERRPDTGIKAATGKIATGTTLGTLANMITLYLGRQIIGDAIDNPLYYSLAAGAVLAALLNAKLYGLVLARYAVNRWTPGLADALRNAKAQARQDVTL